MRMKAQVDHNLVKIGPRQIDILQGNHRIVGRPDVIRNSSMLEARMKASDG